MTEPTDQATLNRDALVVAVALGVARDADVEALLDDPTTTTARRPSPVPGSFTDRAGMWLQKRGLIGSWLRTGAWVTAVLVVGYVLARWAVLLP
jgi:hypothetical protein